MTSPCTLFGWWTFQAGAMSLKFVLIQPLAIQGMPGAPAGGRYAAGMRHPSPHGWVYGVPPAGVPGIPIATAIIAATEVN